MKNTNPISFTLPNPNISGLDRLCKRYGCFIMKTRFINYYPGQAIGENGITYVGEAEPRNYQHKTVRMIIFRCSCGKLFTTTATKVKTGHTASCGCYRDKKISEVNKIHGLSNHRLRYKWSSIKARIFNPNTSSYKYYGGRGIKMYEPWVHDTKSFIEYCMTLEGSDDNTLSLDRINNEGNYEPGNLRFTTPNIQVRNRRKLPGNTSGFTGVAYDIKHNEWQSYIYLNRKKITIYRGKSKQEAINLREEYIIRNQLIGYKLNLQTL